MQDSGKISNEDFTKKYADKLDPAIRGSDKIVHEQRLGNCGMRCILEALRDNIPDAEFREFHHFVTNSFYSEMLENVGINESSLYNNTKNIPSNVEEFIKIIEEKVRQRLNLSSEVKIAGLNGDWFLENCNEFFESYNKFPEVIEFIANVTARNLEIGFIIEKTEKRIIIDNDSYLFSSYKNLLNNTPCIGVIKPFFISRISDQFAEENKLDKELTKKLWDQMFAASYKDNDLPLSEELLAPVKEYLVKTIGKHKGLNQENFDAVLQDWQIGCLTGTVGNNLDTTQSKQSNFLSPLLNSIIAYQSLSTKNPKDNYAFGDIIKDVNQLFSNNTVVDDMVRAPILKGFIDKNEDSNLKLDENLVELIKNIKFKSTFQALDYYKILHEANKNVTEKQTMQGKGEIKKLYDYYLKNVDSYPITKENFAKNQSNVGKLLAKAKAKNPNSRGFGR